MSGNLSTRILTGASGRVGCDSLRAARDRFRMYAIARRSQRRSEFPAHPEPTWIQAEIGNEKTVGRVFSQIHFGHRVEPLLMPRALANVGVSTLDLLGRRFGRRPFEGPWMTEHLERPLAVDASRPRKALDRTPTPRRHILRRALFMIERMKTESEEWTAQRQGGAKAPRQRLALVISNTMLEAGDAIVDAIVAYLVSPVRQHRLARCADMSSPELRWHVGIVYQLLMAAVRTGDRALLLQYVHALARRRHETRFPASELCHALLIISEITISELLDKLEGGAFGHTARSEIRMSIALAIDAVRGEFEAIADTAFLDESEPLSSEDGRGLEDIVRDLDAFLRPQQGPGEPSRPDSPDDAAGISIGVR